MSSSATVARPPAGAADLAPLMELDRGEFTLTKWFKFTPTGLTMAAGKPPLDLFEHLSEFLRILDNGVQWIIGDYILAVESMYGEEASQLIDAAHLSRASASVYRWVCAKVAPVNRNEKLTFSHHQEIAALEPSQQKIWLDRALAGDEGVIWSTARLKREIKNAEAGRELSAASAEFTVTVTCESDADADALCRQLENLGRTNFRKKTPRE